MTAIPRVALALGVAGLIPFAYGAVVHLRPQWALNAIGGRDIVQAYGSAIFCFMSGSFWGLSARVNSRWSAFGFAASVVPFLALMVVVGLGYATLAEGLMGGFALLLVLDFGFVRAGLAPRWWMRLRVMLTIGVIICLGITAYG